MDSASGSNIIVLLLIRVLSRRRHQLPTTGLPADDRYAA
jgi:hypothetical protein